LNASVVTTTGAVTPLAFTLDFTGTTQFGSPFGVNNLTQDGFTSGRLSGLSVANDGTVVGNYTNVKFPNDNGFVEYQISPTWGGNTGDIKTELDSYSFDHSYLSRK